MEYSNKFLIYNYTFDDFFNYIQSYYIENDLLIIYYNLNENQLTKLNSLYVVKNVLDKFNSKILKNINRVLFFFNLDNLDKKSAKNIINKLLKLDYLFKNNNIQIGISDNDKLFISNNIYNNCANYIEDIEISILFMCLENQYEKIDFLYDYFCNKLDDAFLKNNYCDFKDGKCIANREGISIHDRDGCCYYYNAFASLNELKKPSPKCKYLINDKCSTKCITCKLFTCKYLKKKNININLDDYLIANCFLNYKQKFVLSSNFFKTKEQILNKLRKIEKENIILFFFKQDGFIKN